MSTHSYYESTLGLDVIRYGLTNTCFYWEYLGIEEYGKPKLNDPIEIKCRWKWEEGKTVTPEADEKSKGTEIHVDRYMPIGSYVQFKLTDDTIPDIDKAFQVKGMSAPTGQWNNTVNLKDPIAGTVNFKATIGDR
jgi:hypothetical protein